MRKNPGTVLCVDDERNILKALRRLLRKEDYRVLTASSGRKGLQILRENNVEVVLSDQKMPGMLGTEFLKRVNDHYPDVVTAVLTGYADIEIIKEALNRGHISRFFLKPWNGHELMVGIWEMLYAYESRDMAKVFERQVIKHVMALRKRNMARHREVAEQRPEKVEAGADTFDLPHAILEDLPLPIIGVSLEKTVVLANREARTLMRPGTKVNSVRRVAEVVSVDPVSLEEIIEESIRAGSRRSLEGCRVSGEVFTIDVVPLGGKQTGRGVYLRFTPSAVPGA